MISYDQMTFSPTEPTTIERVDVGKSGGSRLPDFDGEHDGAPETVVVEFTHGKRCKDAWTMTIVHPPSTVMLTAAGQ